MNNKLPLKIIFLNVQHGDGILVLLPHEEAYETAMIIDCNDGIKSYNILKEYNIKLIEAVVISHFHSDHYRGFDILFNKLKEEKIKINSIFYYPDKIQREAKEERTYKSILTNILQMAKNTGLITNSNIIDGNKKEKSIYKDKELEIGLIYPRLMDITRESKVNNCSGVVEIKYKGNKILCTNLTSVCKNDCECFGDIIIDIDDNIMVKDYDIKAQSLYCVKNFKDRRISNC